MIYTSHHVMMLTGATYRQIDTWLTHNRVPLTPDATSGPGSGRPRSFQWADVVSFKIMQELTGSWQMSVQAASDIAHVAKDSGATTPTLSRTHTTVSIALVDLIAELRKRHGELFGCLPEDC